MYSDGEVAALLKLGEKGPLTLLPLVATLVQLDVPTPDDPEGICTAGWYDPLTGSSPFSEVLIKLSST